MQQVTLALITSSWYPYLYGLPDFSITYPHSLALSGTFGTIWMCVVSLTLHLHYPLGKCWVSTEQGAEWARDWAWKPWGSEKSLDPARNLTSITHSSIQATHCQPHQLHYHSYPSTVSLILNVCVTAVTDCLYNSHFSFRKKWIWKLYENGLQ